MIRNMSLPEYNHMFLAGYIKDGFRDDVQDLLDFIGDDEMDRESHALKELTQEYDSLDSNNKALKSDLNSVVADLGRLQDDHRQLQLLLVDRDEELKRLKDIPAVRDAIAARLWESIY
jgi:chromosome segregation ATPase